MTAIIWEPTFTAINAAVEAALVQRPSATNTREGIRLRERLGYLGNAYNEVYSDAADRAKELSAERTRTRAFNWEVRAKKAHDPADELARKVLLMAGATLKALAFSTNPSAVTALLANALATVNAGTGFTAEQRNYLPELIAAHQTAVQQGYAGQPTGVVPWEPYDTTPLASLRGDEPVLDQGAEIATVRELEAVLQDAVNDAAVWVQVVGA